eukprot:TRINITY_DN8351_c0_g2_i1.p1 TRINITY_DN8351_c0_g2~~TRINITY_DN8351_c0_g2_i1.p1  ORF type:complete len:355 (+),score=36.76 TRINITY_DN8351_c0_g2_i1:79-1143(+)
MQGLGFAIIIAGGFIGGLFPVPLNHVKGWCWAHSWLLYSIYALLFAPWISVNFTIDHVNEIYQNAPLSAQIAAITCGFGWGVGNICFGLGLKDIGNNLAFAIVMAMTAAFGAAIPLVALHPEDAGNREGVFTWLGLCICIAGLVLLAKAGSRKERDRQQAHVEIKPLLGSVNGDEMTIFEHDDRNFRRGLLLCLLSGLLSPCINMAITFGGAIGDEARRIGGSRMFADNATWTLAVGAGCIPNAGYCMYLLCKDRKWHLFRDASLPLGRNAALSALAGVMWFGGNMLYTAGSELVGDMGTVIGWPIFCISLITTSSIYGFARGEWKGSSKQTLAMLAAGMVLLVVAVIVIALGS